MSKVSIEADTARYYLRFESAIETFFRDILNADIDQVFNMNPNERYGYRADLHDAWEKAVAKKPFKPTANPRGIQDATLRSIRRSPGGHHLP